MMRGWFLPSLITSIAGHGIAVWYWQNTSTVPPVVYVEVGEVSVDIEAARSTAPTPASTPGKKSPKMPTPQQSENARQFFLAVEEVLESSISEIAHLGAEIESAAETALGKVVEQASKPEKPIEVNDPKPEQTKEPVKDPTPEPAPMGAVASTPQQAAMGASERKKGVRTEAKRRDGSRLAYPAEALPRRLQGRVVVRLQIDAQGKVIHAEIAQSSGHSILDEAALTFSRRVELDPATEDGVPVPTLVHQPYNFYFPVRD